MDRAWGVFGIPAWMLGLISVTAGNEGTRTGGKAGRCLGWDSQGREDGEPEHPAFSPLCQLMKFSILFIDQTTVSASKTIFVTAVSCFQ